jgi:septal ring factor EnvC (AmiA/AmiB activator)
MSATVNYTDDFHRFWREEGSMLPPADTATPEQFEQLKRMAAAVFNAATDHESKRIAEIQKQCNELEDENESLSQSIAKTKAKLDEISDLLK